jgi:hypothetical protein
LYDAAGAGSGIRTGEDFYHRGHRGRRTEITEKNERWRRIGDEYFAWDDFVGGAGGDCGVAAGVDWVAGDWVVGGVVGGEDGAGAGIWVYWGCFDWVDWVGDWGMDFYTVGNWACEYVFIFAGGGYGWSGAAGVGGTFVFWGEGIGEEFAQRAQRKSTEITEEKNIGQGKTAPLKAKGAAPGTEGSEEEHRVQRETNKSKRGLYGKPTQRSAE